MKLVIGCHIHKSSQLGDSNKSGFKTFAEALQFYHEFAAEHEFNMTAGQFFASQPQQMDSPIIEPPEAKELNDTAKRLGVELVIHAPYVITPFGTAKSKKFAHKCLRRELSLAGSMSHCKGVIVHLQNVSPDDIVADLRDLISKFKDDIPDSILYLENEVRRNVEWGYSSPQQFGELAKAIHEANLPLKVGLCLDTAHLWISGVDLRDHTREYLRDFDHAMRDHKLPLMLHLNDAPNPLGQGRDAHAPLTQGHIWKDHTESLKEILDWADHHLHGPIILERTGKFEWPDGERNLTREIANDFRVLEKLDVNRIE